MTVSKYIKLNKTLLQFQGGGLQKKFKNNKFKRRGVKSEKVKNGN